MVVVEGTALGHAPLEAVGTIPVIRSAVTGRSPAEILDRVGKARSRRLTSSNTKFFLGLPRTSDEYARLQETAGLTGAYSESWEKPEAAIRAIGTSVVPARSASALHVRPCPLRPPSSIRLGQPSGAVA